MRRPRILQKSGTRPTGSSSDASLSYDAPIETILADLQDLGVEGLRRQWRDHLGGEAPAHVPRWLLAKVLAHRLQVAAFGGLDKSTRRLISEFDEEGAAVPFDRRDPHTKEGVGLKTGALLVREWKGELQRVMVLEEGFAWSGKTYGSLSQIAKAMTGTNWNGHRFFGLREGNGRDGRKRANRQTWGAGQEHSSEGDSAQE
jgi:hypothetical protein